MGRGFILLACVLCFAVAVAADAEDVSIRILGPTPTCIPSVTGPMGVFGPSYHPASRFGAFVWRDTLNPELMWLFGGSSPSCLGWGTADVWAFNTTLRQWAFMAGLNDSTNCNISDVPVLGPLYGVYGATYRPTPRGVGGVWTPSDQPGIAYLFGGIKQSYFDSDSTPALDTMWSFDSSTRQWAYWGNGTGTTSNRVAVNGFSPLNAPGARYSFGTWLAADNTMWFFGGDNRDDLWGFKVVPGQAWNWKNLIPRHSGVMQYKFGAVGSSAGVIMGWARKPGVSVDLANPNIAWIFGGHQNCNGSSGGALICDHNLLFSVDTTTAAVTYWGGGGQLVSHNFTTIYGTKHVASPMNWPGGRQDMLMFAGRGLSNKGVTYLVGGANCDLPYPDNYFLADIWALISTNGQNPRWVWVGGDDGTERFLTSPTTNFAIIPQMGSMSAGMVVPSLQNPYIYTTAGFNSPSQRSAAVVDFCVLAVTFSTAPSDGFLHQLRPVVVRVAAIPTAYTLPVNDPGLVAWLVLDPPNATVTCTGCSAPVVNGYANFTSFQLSGVGTFTLRVDLSMNGLTTSHIYSNPITVSYGHINARLRGPFQSSNSAYQTYGPRGVFGPDYVPAGRVYTMPWRDTLYPDLIWNYGGKATNTTPYWATSAELWAYNTTSRQWAFMAGTSEWDGVNVTRSVSYCGVGCYSASNKPSGRMEHMTWVTPLAPGIGYMAGGISGDWLGNLDTWNFDSMWSWNSTLRQWAFWGNSTINSTVVVNDFSPLNNPANRRNAATWTSEADGTMYLYGGDSQAYFTVFPMPILFFNTGSVRQMSELWAMKVINGRPFCWKQLTPQDTRPSNPQQNPIFGSYGVEGGVTLGYLRWMSGLADPIHMDYAWIFSGEIIGYFPASLLRMNMTSGSTTSFNWPTYYADFGTQHAYSPSNRPPAARQYQAWQGKGTANKNIMYFVGGQNMTAGTTSGVWALVVTDPNDPKWIWIGGLSTYGSAYPAGTTTTDTFSDWTSPFAMGVSAAVPSALNPYVMTIATFSTLPACFSNAIIEFSWLTVEFSVAPTNGVLGQIASPVVHVAAIPVNYTSPVNDPGFYVVLTIDPPVSGAVLSSGMAPVVNGYASFTGWSINQPGYYRLRVDINANGWVTTYLYSSNFTLTCGTNCSSCDATGCLTCQATYQRYQGACWAVCPDGTYASGSVCVACAVGCTTCSGAGLANCRLCDASRNYAIDGITPSNACYDCTSSASYYIDSLHSYPSKCSVCPGVLGCTTSATTCTTFWNVRCPSCVSGRFLLPGANATADTCPTCTPVTNCSSALTCASATTSRCTTCQAGSYLVVGNATTPDRCLTCTTSSAGKYISTPCSATADAIFSPCLVCASNQFLASACTNTANTVCTNCTAGCKACTAVGLTPTTCSQCDTSVGFAIDSVGFTGNCRDCTTATCPGCYIDQTATPPACFRCVDVTGCTSLVTCGNSSNSRCSACAGGKYLHRGTASTADTCNTCTVNGDCPGSYISTDCSATADAVCTPCSTCAQGSFVATPCGSRADTVCTNCTAVSACSSITCAGAANSRCTACATGHYLVPGAGGLVSDTCPDCATCPTGQYKTGGCVGAQDTTCQTCNTGCAACTARGLNTAVCQSCDGSIGYALARNGSVCVPACGSNEYVRAANATHAAQCDLCTTGCASCSGPGLDYTHPCAKCDESMDYLVDYGGDACVAECETGYYRNITSHPYHCSSCVGAYCGPGYFVGCTGDHDSTCTACTEGCATCHGLGLDLNVYCTACDEAHGWASDANGTCVRCAANCTLCSGSPTHCQECAVGYKDAPGCAPNCSSPGCVTCYAPDACGAICAGAFSGEGCLECSADAVIGSEYPNCISSKQTDIVATGTTMGLLLCLVALVVVIALWNPLDIFYQGQQVVHVNGQEFPLTVDFVLSKRKLTLKMTPTVEMTSAFVEGIRIMPNSIEMKRSEADPDSDNKDEVSTTMNLTKAQTATFLGGGYRLDITVPTPMGPNLTRYKLRIPMRVNSSNLLAIFTLLVETIQLSSFCFGTNVSWWSKDPVPYALHYSILVLPPIAGLWYIVFWLLVGLAAFFVAMVIMIKTRCLRSMSNLGCYGSFTQVMFGTVLPFIGQTLYLPVLSVMLSVMSCSRDVTNPSKHFFASFDPNVVCWDGGHWTYVVVAIIVVLVYYPAAVLSAPLWQIVDADLDVRYFPSFLVTSGQVKFILAVTAQMFSNIPFLQSGLLILFSMPCIALILRSPPTIIYRLRWPTMASYGAVAWVGVSSIIALMVPNSWVSNISLYVGWLVIFGSSITATMKGVTDKPNAQAASAIDRVFTTSASAKQLPVVAKSEAFAEPPLPAGKEGSDRPETGEEKAVDESSALHGVETLLSMEADDSASIAKTPLIPVSETAAASAAAADTPVNATRATPSLDDSAVVESTPVKKPTAKAAATKKPAGNR